MYSRILSTFVLFWKGVPSQILLEKYISSGVFSPTGTYSSAELHLFSLVHIMNPTLIYGPVSLDTLPTDTGIIYMNHLRVLFPTLNFVLTHKQFPATSNCFCFSFLFFPIRWHFYRFPLTSIFGTAVLFLHHLSSLKCAALNVVQLKSMNVACTFPFQKYVYLLSYFFLRSAQQLFLCVAHICSAHVLVFVAVVSVVPCTFWLSIKQNLFNVSPRWIYARQSFAWHFGIIRYPYRRNNLLALAALLRLLPRLLVCSSLTHA